LVLQQADVPYLTLVSLTLIRLPAVPLNVMVMFSSTAVVATFTAAPPGTIV
jgi:hypothetical protein